MNKKHNKEELLAVGDKLFRDNGYHNTGTEEILEKADYPRSSFYHHFKNKEGFGVKTVEFYGQNIKQLLEDIMLDRTIDSPMERLKKYYYMICSYQQSCDFGTCCLVQRMSIDAGDMPGALQKEAHNQFKEWVDVASICVAEGQEKGEIRKDMSVPEISEFLFSTMYGSFTIARLSHDPKEMEKKITMAFKMIQA